MRRIVLLLFRLIFILPYNYFKIHDMAKHNEKYTLEERYNFIRNFVLKIIKAAHVDIVSSGVEKLPQEDGYLIAPNHQGMFDILMIAKTHEKPVTAVGKIEVMKMPFVKDVMNALPAKAMDRSNLRESVKLIRQISKEIAEGRNYIIFPEGTRSKNGNQLGEFKGGTMKAAVDAKKPIVPVALIDAFIPFDSKSIKRVTTEIHYLDPIYYDEYKDLSSIELASMIQNRIQTKIDNVLATRN